MFIFNVYFPVKFQLNLRLIKLKKNMKTMKFHHILKKSCFYKIEVHHKFEFWEALSWLSSLFTHVIFLIDFPISITHLFVQ